MSGRQAKLITPHTLRRMIAYARRTEQAERNVAIIFLSAKAGLRACEIARLEWPMLLTDTGRVADTLELRNAIAKMGSGRRIPLHPILRTALCRLYSQRISDQYVIGSARGGSLRANSVVNFFVQMSLDLGLEGCSSHSGRRTFVTMAARNVHRTGGSLRDVQLLAGHKSIETTQGYIQGNTQSQRRLVTLI